MMVRVVLAKAVEARLSLLFPGTRATAARDVLRPEQSERVLVAVLTLSQGDLDRLQYFSDAADADWRDVLYWAENSPSDDEPRSYEELLERLHLPPELRDAAQPPPDAVS
jgi:hypothetical protein